MSAAPASAANKYLEVPPEAEAVASPAYHYANMTNAQALAELEARGIPFRRATPPMPGVRLPIRLTGPLQGVTIHSVLPEAEREATPFEIMDGRLALVLDDFARILALHDIVEVVHFTIYRPSPKLPADPNAPQTRHPGGMAIDLGAMKKKNGEWLAVGPHWTSAIGARTCGAQGRKLRTVKGRELLSIVCEARDQRLFHYMLTPYFNEPHADHWHLEIKPDTRWFLVN